MAKIIICDKCKKELKFGEGFNGAIWGNNKHINIDVCDECVKDVVDYIGTTIISDKTIQMINKKSEDKE